MGILQFAGEERERERWCVGEGHIVVEQNEHRHWSRSPGCCFIAGVWNVQLPFEFLDTDEYLLLSKPLVKSQSNVKLNADLILKISLDMN